MENVLHMEVEVPSITLCAVGVFQEFLMSRNTKDSCSWWAVYPRAQDSAATLVPDQDTRTVADTGLMNIHQQCNTTRMVWKSSAHALALDYCSDVEMSREMIKDFCLSDDSVTLNNAEKQLGTGCSWDARFAELLKVFPMSSWPVKSLIFQCQLP